LLVAAAAAAPVAKHNRVLLMSATAYSTHGLQASGLITREGTAAADPKILPLGSRVRVHSRSGRLVGVFVITDTGKRIRGHELDIFFKNVRAARRFGRKSVRVEVLKWGQGAAHARVAVLEGLTPPTPQ
jgi:3D (Asp-Asp-Asp) domain-containing protein